MVSTLNAMKLDYQRMLRDIDVKQAQVASDQASFDRFSGLMKGGGVTRAEYDNARFLLMADKQSVEALKVTAAVQLARLGGDPGCRCHDHVRLSAGAGAGGRDEAAAWIIR